MTTLLMRLSGPMQSWGLGSKFENRRGTERTPTKSGVIGLVAAALGRRRDESIRDLAALKYGVRVDKEGELLRDYHIAGIGLKSPYVTNRYYLADSTFLVGLEGDFKLLSQIQEALLRPRFPLYLGRRSCPPEGKLVLGIRKKDLLSALNDEPYLGSADRRDVTANCRIVMDADSDDKYIYFLKDVPHSFDQTHRRFGYRRVFETDIEVERKARGPFGGVTETQHDALAGLE